MLASYNLKMQASVISFFRNSLKYGGGWRELLREVDRGESNVPEKAMIPQDQGVIF